MQKGIHNATFGMEKKRMKRQSQMHYLFLQKKQPRKEKPETNKLAYTQKMYCHEVKVTENEVTSLQLYLVFALGNMVMFNILKIKLSQQELKIKILKLNANMKNMNLTLYIY